MSRIILCDSYGKETHMLWEFVFDINIVSKYSNHSDLQGFTNIYISLGLISLVSVCVCAYLFSIWMKYVRSCRVYNRTLFG